MQAPAPLQPTLTLATEDGLHDAPGLSKAAGSRLHSRGRWRNGVRIGGFRDSSLRSLSAHVLVNVCSQGGVPPIVVVAPTWMIVSGGPEDDPDDIDEHGAEEGAHDDYAHADSYDQARDDYERKEATKVRCDSWRESLASVGWRTQMPDRQGTQRGPIVRGTCMRQVQE